MNTTKIEWTHFPGYDKGMSWNPIRARLLSNGPAGKTGWACVHMGEGCRFCYAESMNRRLGTGQPYTAQAKGTYEVYLDEKTLLAPLKMKGKVCFFTNSMTDLFGLDFGVTEEMLARIYAVMALTPQHLYLNLTKRSKARREWLSNEETENTVYEAVGDVATQNIYPKLEEGYRVWRWPLRNVFEGSSIACTKDLHQVADLLYTPAHKRFISYEPAIEGIDLSNYLTRGYMYNEDAYDKKAPVYVSEYRPKLDWVIIGGESGSKARPFDIDWARQTIAQCKQSGVPCFVKQLGSNPYSHDRHDFEYYTPCVNVETLIKTYYAMLDDKKGGNTYEWPEDLRVRQFPEV